MNDIKQQFNLEYHQAELEAESLLPSTEGREILTELLTELLQPQLDALIQKEVKKFFEFNDPTKPFYKRKANFDLMKLNRSELFLKKD